MLNKIASRVVLTVLITVVSVAYANDAPDRIVVFGDSLSDPGNFYIAFGETTQPPFFPIPNAPYSIGGHHFTNGKTWAEQVADTLESPTSGLPALLAPSRFTNYAVGGARARANAPEFPYFDLTSQVNLFLANSAGRAPPDSVYVMWIGGNDLRDALVALATDPSMGTSAGIVEAAVAGIANNIVALWGAGARSFLILEVPDISITPVARSLGPAAVDAAFQLNGLFNTGLQQSLEQVQALTHASILSMDENALLRSVIAHPDAFGLVNVTDPCLRFGVLADAICADPDKYLFWDGLHPTTRGHSILAHAAVALLEQSHDAAQAVNR